MALHKQVDFAALCGVSKGYLSVNKKRGKVILSGDYVDDSIEPNCTFLRKCLEKKNELELNQDAIREDNIPAPNVCKPKRENKSPNVDAPSKSDLARYNLESRKKEFEAENFKLRNALLIQQLEKKQGESIPKQLTLLAYNANFKMFIRNVKNAMDKHMTRWSKHFTAEEIALAKKEILQDINHAQVTAIDDLKKSIAEIVAASSIQKDVGQRE